MPRGTLMAGAFALACLACAKPERPAATPTPPAAAAPAAPPSAAAPSEAPTPAPDGQRLSASRAAEEACVDKWLAERRLDPYGGPEGSLYAGGTPLFDEKTGERVDRLEYVYKRQPLARAACRPIAIN
jgi:hypothetical protein